MTEHQRHHATDGEARLRIILEVTHGKSGPHGDSLQRGVQRLEVVCILRTLFRYLTGIRFLHDTGQHQEGLTTCTVGIRPELRIVFCDDAQVGCLADIPHHPGLLRGYLHHVGIIRERITRSLKIRLDIERLHQCLQHMHPGDTVFGLESQSVTVERSNAVAILQIEQCLGRPVVIGGIVLQVVIHAGVFVGHQVCRHVIGSPVSTIQRGLRHLRASSCPVWLQQSVLTLYDTESIEIERRIPHFSGWAVGEKVRIPHFYYLLKVLPWLNSRIFLFAAKRNVESGLIGIVKTAIPCFRYVFS